ncbi:hypothetical protein JAAARDRAFT_52022 [Jaapia argillacea MUCL 33604]|uniref:F-box domain-containing protein n=1 Tax=Jaapia argillacea MUCL 33604 TaxID=933084 RepID=A0A067QA98_9AGAM|nr:hypothetical protein JAAARDRAFT_52022 [Jaapia argillacea MUCL 33604]
MKRFRSQKQRRTRQPQALEDCPREIWEHIFSLACVDGGFTARSLSLVSRYIKDVSQTTRYQCVAIRGLVQLQSFASVLKKSPPSNRHVRHLFISGCPPKGNGAHSMTSRIRSRLRFRNDDSDSDESSYLARIRQGEELQSRLDKASDLSPKFNKILGEVIELIGPDSLETLSCIICSMVSLPPLPNLRELTICGDWHETTTSFSFPSLRRLHLLGPYCSESDIQLLIQSAPALTHLRLSGLEERMDLSSFIKSILGVPSDDYLASSSSSPRPIHLERLLVHPRNPTRFGCGFAHGCYLNKLHGIQQLLEGHTEGKGVLLQSKVWDRDFDSEIDREKELWVSRMSGGLGCWDESSRVVPDQPVDVWAVVF